MASIIYDSFIADVFNGNCTTANSYKGMLTTSSYVENRGTQSKRSDITNEVTGAGYTAGGNPLTLSVSLNTTTHVLTLNIGTVSWSTSTITARKLVVYRDRGGAASADELVCCIDFGNNVSSSATTFEVAASTWAIPLPPPV